MSGCAATMRLVVTGVIPRLLRHPRASATTTRAQAHARCTCSPQHCQAIYVTVAMSCDMRAATGPGGAATGTPMRSLPLALFVSAVRQSLTSRPHSSDCRHEGNAPASASARRRAYGAASGRNQKVLLPVRPWRA
jgi:hypothetical protein